MSRSDTPINCLIRYRAVARLQLSHFCCPDTTPRASCLCDCPLGFLRDLRDCDCNYVCVSYLFILIVCARFNRLWAPASRHSRATPWFGELRSPPLPQKASSYINLVLSHCSRRYRQYKLHFQTHPPPHLSQLLEDARQPPTPTHSSCVDMVHTCPSWRRGGRADYRVNTHTESARHL
jgi:hypothetical protein